MKPNMIPCDPSEAVLAVCNGVELDMIDSGNIPWRTHGGCWTSTVLLQALNATFYKERPEPVPPPGYRVEFVQHLRLADISEGMLVLTGDASIEEQTWENAREYDGIHSSWIARPITPRTWEVDNLHVFDSDPHGGRWIYVDAPVGTILTGTLTEVVK